MKSRQRVLISLKHQEPDRIPVDLGGMLSTGITGIAYNQLKKYLGIKNGRTRMYDLFQQLAEPETEVLERVGADVLPVMITYPKKWKKSILPDNSNCEVPEDFNSELLPNGDKVIKDGEGRVIAKMPKGGYYFDSVYHPWESVKTVKDLAKAKFPSIFYPSLTEENLQDLKRRVEHLYYTTDYALLLNGAGNIYEIAQGLRGWDRFMIDLIENPIFAGALLDKVVEENINRLKKILPIVNEYIQVIQVGDDLGMQDGPQLSPKLYRKVVKPRHAELFKFIKENCSAYLFIHTCGSVYEFIPDFIEMGVDILNPVQVSAKNMESEKLKEEFGKDIVFWGGGCDTQYILPFGTPEEVRKEVRKRIEDFAPGGGFVFNQVHNIQPGVPPKNIMAMYEAVKEFGTYQKK